MSIHHHKPYKLARKARYPKEGDQLDALWKALDVLFVQTGATPPPEMVEIVQRITAVKEQCPKEGLLRKKAETPERKKSGKDK